MVGVHVGQLDVDQQQHLSGDGAREATLGLFLHLGSVCIRQSALCVITWSLVRLSLSLICWVTILSISSLSMGY